MATANPSKDPITCHVLDTSIGQPARGVRVKLELTPTAASVAAAAAAAASSAVSPGGHGQGTKTFESQTDEDGRVATWLPYSSATASGEVPIYTLEDVLGDIDGPSRWTLRFDIAAYFGGEDRTFFPEAVIVFTVQPGQHYHVPLLLAPYSYSTYRGS